MSDQKITDEFVRNVRLAVKVTTYLLRHPTRFTSNNCSDMREARKAAMELLDTVLVARADLEHMTLEQRERYIETEGQFVVLPREPGTTPFAPPELQSDPDADDIPF